MSKIKILIIDDKPIHAYRSNYAFDHIPEVMDDTYGKFPELDSLFELYWLQSPEDTKEFRDYCIQYENNYGSFALGKLGIVPDIILFDYALTGEMAKKITAEALLKMPNVILGKELNDPSYRINKSKPIKAPAIKESDNEIQVKDIPSGHKINHDNMGCFSGGLIYMLFRNHPCAAVPTTRKFLKHVQGTHTEYFEWLIKDELYEATDNRGNTVSWSGVIPLAVNNLRNNIIIQVTCKKIIPSLKELCQVATDRNEVNIMNGCFRYLGMYGIHELPLAALFMDIPRKERAGAIRQWTKELFSAAFTDLDNTMIAQAIIYADTLWNAFQSELFCHRINLSKLYKVFNKERRTELTTEERGQYHEYMKLEDNKYFKLKETGRGNNNINYEIVNTIELKNLITDKSATEYTDYDKQILSYASLFVIMQLYKIRMDFIKKTHQINCPLPTKKEILTVLFPIASTHIVMPIHNGDDSSHKKFLNSVLFFCLDEVVDGTADIFNESQKRILRSYALSIGFNDNRYFPEWIKSNEHD